MSPDTFPLKAPEATDFSPLVREVSQLLALDLRSQIRNEIHRLPAQATSTGTTAPATEERVVLTRDVLVATVDNVGKAKKQLDALKTYLDAVEEYATEQVKFHADFKSYVERTASQLALRSKIAAPIRWLPNEVLQLIFLEVHALSTEKERYNPVTAQVCTLWRQLAHATPSLWTTINVNLKAGEKEGICAVAEMETRFERAKRQLVAVSFVMIEPKCVPSYSDGSDSDSDTDCVKANVGRSNRHFQAAVSSLLQYRDRIASLRIPRHGEGLGGYLMTECGTEDVAFANLHTLSLYEGHHSPGNFDAKPLLKACPNIQRLRIFEAKDTDDIHWGKLKEFIGVLSVGALSKFLLHAREVEQAELSSLFSPLASVSWSDLPNIPNLSFSNRLTALALHDVLPPCAIRLAALPCPPNLRYLALTGSIGFPGAFIRSWGPHLEFLGFSFNVTGRYLKEIVPYISNLQGLRLAGEQTGVPAGFFHRFPQLTHLEIRTSFKSSTDIAFTRLINRVLDSQHRGKRFALRSVTFLPVNQQFWDSRQYSSDDSEAWEKVYRHLNKIAVEVHEYRTQKPFDTPTFSTPLFKERGWCI